MQSAAGKKAIEQEVLEGKGLAELEVGLGGADSKAGAAEEEEGEEIENRVPEKGAVEVPLEELAVRPARGRRELFSPSHSGLSEGGTGDSDGDLVLNLTDSC